MCPDEQRPTVERQPGTTPGSLQHDKRSTHGSARDAGPGATTIYTDGSCLGNPGPGGWAWVVRGGPFASGSEELTTNQRMEVMAVLQALKAISGPVTIISDSTYVVNCFRHGWWRGWIKRGWRNSKGAAVANQDLWKPLLAEIAERDPDQVTFRWVKGHAGDAMNAQADQLAVEAAQRQVGRSGPG